MEFQKHYQLPIVHLLDANRTFEKKYHRGGWPFLMLADKKGQVVYKNNALIESEMSKITGLLDSMLRQQPEVEVVTADGVSYMPATLQRSGESKKARRCDRFPSLACGPDGKVYVVFTTNRNGNSDVFIRVFDGKVWSGDKPVAATAADEYDGMVVADKQNRVWVSWTSNADGKNYNIFVTSFVEPAESFAAEQITHAYDDAMHARMACDNQGSVWVTYYKWLKEGGRGGGASRDKEVYIRRWKDGIWWDEVQVSPTDVPWYEDHSEPAITAYGNKAIVCWSWDYHQPKGYTKDAKEPTIFARSISNALKPGKIVAVSGKNIDVTPTIAIGKDGRIWCAWDSLGREENLDSERKNLCVGEVTFTDSPRAEILMLSKAVVNVCTPSFAVSPTGIVTLAWSETSDLKGWVLKQAEFDQVHNRWSRAKTIESKGNPRYCSAAYDGKGQLWIAYSEETDIGREIIITKLKDKDSVAAPDNILRRVVSGVPDNERAIAKLR